ncbi:hypothetical protein B0H19DRAFT_1159899 [Mycena capillaripes]|nr:hypothetical protein B0H19DRAFT_1159899 [Mycena capillaripes]
MLCSSSLLLGIALSSGSTQNWLANSRIFGNSLGWRIFLGFDYSWSAVAYSLGVSRQFKAEERKTKTSSCSVPNRLQNVLVRSCFSLSQKCALPQLLAYFLHISYNRRVLRSLSSLLRIHLHIRLIPHYIYFSATFNDRIHSLPSSNACFMNAEPKHIYGLAFNFCVCSHRAKIQGWTREKGTLFVVLDPDFCTVAQRLFVSPSFQFPHSPAPDS